MLLTPAQIKLSLSLSLSLSFIFFYLFYPGVDASRIYVRAWALGCFHSLISTQTPSTGLRHASFMEEGAGKRCSECDQYPNREGADRVGGQLHGDKECPFSGVTKTGRVWWKVPESDARSVGFTQPTGR